MSSSNRSSKITVKDSATPSANQIREQVEKIIRSPGFVHSKRMQRFLKFTVEQVLKGKGDSIKEYSIALEVFDKPSSFDPRLDPIVRVEAGRLRSKLREYYSDLGKMDPIRILYRKRSYVPHFEDQMPPEEVPRPRIHSPSDRQPSDVVLEKPLDLGDQQKFRAVAVLPFINLSDSQKNEYFSDAITAEIINVLNQTIRLNVVSRTSVLRFKDTDQDIREIGNRLGVDAILEGNVRLAGKRVRVAVQLANAANGFQIWSEIYDREIKDIFSVQQELAQSIAKALKAELHKVQPETVALFGTENSEAYHQYLRGRHYLSTGLSKNLKNAINLFKNALAGDPRYALAFVGLSEAYAALSWWGSIRPEEGWREASETAQKARQINPSLGQAYIALANISAGRDWSWERAESEYLRGLEYSPNYAGAHHFYGFMSLLPQGKLLEAEAELKTAHELNPSSAPTAADLGWIYCCKRDYSLALDQLIYGTRLDPLYFRSYLYLGYVYEQQSKMDKALEAFMKAEELSSREPAASGAVGRCLGLMGNKKAALERIKNLTRRYQRTYVSALDIANILIGIGEADAAFKWAEKALKDRCPRITHIRTNPAFDPLKSDPRFLDLLKELNLDYASV
jgi:serine/threonine-protein kinase